MIRPLLLGAGVALVAAGCSGGTSPSVANLAQTQDEATTQSASPVAPNGGAAPSGGNYAIKVQNGTKFSSCMRSHGVPNFPDPNAQGVLQFGGNGIDPSSPKFQAAMSACRKTQPNGGQPSPAQIAKAQQAALEFSACMRSHGLKDFPDPSFHGGAVQLSLRGGPGSDLDPSSPLFQNAQRACLHFSPGKPILAPVGGGPK